MKILVVHNRYQQLGGEDCVFRAEVGLLGRMGHEVVEFLEYNNRISRRNPLKAGTDAMWSLRAQRRIRELIRESNPDVVHFHNTFLRISPAAYYACKEAGVPVVQTLHNYRLLCPAATLLWDGRACEDCLGKPIPWPGVVHGCWRGSRAQTAMAAAMITIHRWLRTWNRQVDLYIALTEFARHKFIEGGLPAEKIVVKPNFVEINGLRVKSYKLGVTSNVSVTRHSSPVTESAYTLFVGRLSPEKGVRTLLQAWQGLKGVPLKIVGDGPLKEKMENFVQEHKLQSVEILGWRHHEDVLALLKGSAFLVFPSEWYETFGRSIAEAFACGVPVLASRLGAMAEIVADGRAGLLFEPSNPEDLATKVAWAWSHPRQIAEMGREARREYEQKYTANRNYKMLMEIYRLAKERHRQR